MIPQWTSTTSISKGDVVLVLFPDASGSVVKARPAVVVQSDNVRTDFAQWVMVPLTSQVWRRHYGCRILIQQNTPQHSSMNLKSDSLIMADKPQTIEARLVRRNLGVCLQQTIAAIDDALRHVLSL